MEKRLFKLGKSFVQQVLEKVSTLKVQFKNWERSFLLENYLCAPSVSDVENNIYIADIFRKIQIGNQLLRSWNISFLLVFTNA